jgi:hypothetical protein
VTQAGDLQRLVERIEAATGPSFVLDCNIGRVLRPDRESWPAYTVSLDAALTLVPAGRDWMVDNFDGPIGRRCSASVFNDPSDEFADYEAFAATPAMALTSAALRARITQENSNDPSSNG